MNPESNNIELAVRMEQINREEAAERRARLNNNFVQFGREGIKPFRSLMARSSVAARILLCLAEDMSPTAEISYAIDALMGEAGVSRSAVFAGLKLLEQENWIQKMTDSTGVFYRINSRVFWCSSNLFRAGSFSVDLNVSKEDVKPRGKRSSKRVFLPRISVRKTTKKR